eukprot:scaffold65764_cov39-Phaeocystis_antarctica.AAC.2
MSTHLIHDEALDWSRPGSLRNYAWGSTPRQPRVARGPRWPRRPLSLRKLSQRPDSHRPEFTTGIQQNDPRPGEVAR